MVPNRKSAHQSGYCNLWAEDQKTGGDRLYKNLCLSDFFNDCQWRVESEDPSQANKFSAEAFDDI